MRRMNSKNGIIDIVNEAIDEGQIEVGGGLPEIEEGDAGKVLKVNEAEDGVEWGEAGGGETIPYLILDCNGTYTPITPITQEQMNKIANHEYAIIYILNYRDRGNFTLLPTNNVNNAYLSVLYKQNGGSNNWTAYNQTYTYIKLFAYNNQLTINDFTTQASYSTETCFVGASGYYNKYSNLGRGYQDVIFWYSPNTTDTNRIRAKLNWEYINQDVMAVGKAVFYDNTGTTPTTYKIVIDLTNGQWTATSI